MTPRLLPLLLYATLLAGCHEHRPPPQTIRLRVTAASVLAKTTKLPGNPAILTNWLSTEIAHRRINPDVRLDFDFNVPVWRMVETFRSILNAGARADPALISLAFNISGSSGEDFLLSLNPPSFEWSEDTLQTAASDMWGDHVIITRPGKRHIECEVSLTNDTLSISGEELTPQDFRDMLLARRQVSTSVYLVIHADQNSTAVDLLPALQIARECDILTNLGAESPGDLTPDTRQKPHPAASPLSIRTRATPLDAFLHTNTPARQHHGPVPSLLPPAHFEIFTGIRMGIGQGQGHSGGAHRHLRYSSPEQKR